SIVVLGVSGTAKVDCAAGNVIATGPVPGTVGGAWGPIGLLFDVMGTLVATYNGSTYWRINAQDLSIMNTYVVSNWGVGSSPPVYDQLEDSVWIAEYGGSAAPNRLFLDRGIGAGMGEDVIISSIMSEAGYS